MTANVLSFNGELVYQQTTCCCHALKFFAMSDACKDALGLYYFVNEFMQVNLLKR